MLVKMESSSAGGGYKKLTADLNNLITSITTRNASWTATDDCIMIGTVYTTTNTAAQVSFDGNVVVSMETNSTSQPLTRVGYGNMGFAVPKGTVVTTRSDSSGNYNLKFYGIEK